jgi:hypothetical protein
MLAQAGVLLGEEVPRMTTDREYLEQIFDSADRALACDAGELLGLIDDIQREMEQNLEDAPIFTAGALETLEYGPSWASIIILGFVGIVVLIVILLFA